VLGLGFAGEVVDHIEARPVADRDNLHIVVVLEKSGTRNSPGVEVRPPTGVTTYRRDQRAF
jgi:hypothetical protein